MNKQMLNFVMQDAINKGLIKLTLNDNGEEIIEIIATKEQIKEHLQWLKKFTDCKEVKSVPSRNRRKVQRKTNKSNESSTAHV